MEKLVQIVTDKGAKGVATILNSAAEQHRSIKDWATEDRPREKLQSLGRTAVTDAELLAILIATGTGKRSALQLAQDLLALVQNDLNKLGKMTTKEMTQVKGIGQAKAITIFAALELGRRRKSLPFNEQKAIKSSHDSFQELAPYLTDLMHEEFRVLFLNNANKVLKNQKISIGGMAATVVDIRIILKQAIEIGAFSIICAHNHPSGQMQPSKSDIDITKKLKEGCKTLDINLLDHLIICDNQRYYSFADEGIL